jgi:hypothetical protein
MKKEQTFEEFLKEYFNNSSESDGILDDDLAEAEENWIANLDIDKLIEFADEYGKERGRIGFDKGLKLNKINN